MVSPSKLCENIEKYKELVNTLSGFTWDDLCVLGYNDTIEIGETKREKLLLALFYKKEVSIILEPHFNTINTNKEKLPEDYTYLNLKGKLCSCVFDTKPCYRRTIAEFTSAESLEAQEHGKQKINIA